MIRTAPLVAVSGFNATICILFKKKCTPEQKVSLLCNDQLSTMVTFLCSQRSHNLSLPPCTPIYGSLEIFCLGSGRKRDARSEPDLQPMPLADYINLHLPATLEKFTTLPWAFFTSGRKVLVTSTIPQRFTSAIRLNRSSGAHSMGSK